MRRAVVSTRRKALAGVCAAGVLAGGMAGAAVPAAAATTSRTVQVWLASDEQAAQQFVTASATPGSPGYHHFLSPAAYSQRFGQSVAHVKAVMTYLASKGFTGVRASVNDVYIQAVAPSSVGSHLAFPAAIRPDVLAVTGLTDKGPIVSRPAAAPVPVTAKAATVPCSHYWAQHTQPISPVFEGVRRSSTDVCGYSAQQIRAAYGLTKADTGQGAKIAVIEVGGQTGMFRALTDYARANGLPAPRHGQYRTETAGVGVSRNGCLNGSLEESAIDVESLYAMAPSADQVMVDGDDCDTSNEGAEAVLDAMLAPLTGTGAHASVSIESVSYTLAYGGESATAPLALKISHAIALRAAAEGVSMLVSSGDYFGVDAPASDPDVTAVGGTTLGIGAGNQRLFETGWATTFGERTGTSGAWKNIGPTLGAGGGASNVYGEPGYQKGVVPSSMSRDKAGKPARTVPDVAADADPYTGMLFGVIVPRKGGGTYPYETFRQAGTSLAAPLVAGTVADAEQGQNASFGLLNPLLYSLSGTPAFHDIVPVSSSMPATDRGVYSAAEVYIHKKYSPGFIVGANDEEKGTGQVTVPGYDTTTGLGSPNGGAFIAG